MSVARLRVDSFATYAYSCSICPLEFFVLFLGLKTIQKFQQANTKAIRVCCKWIHPKTCDPMFKKSRCGINARRAIFRRYLSFSTKISKMNPIKTTSQWNQGWIKGIELKESPLLDSLLTAIWSQSFLLDTWKRNDNETMLTSCLGSS